MFAILATVIQLSSGQVMQQFESQNHYRTLRSCNAARIAYTPKAKAMLREYYPQGGVRGTLKCVKA